MAVLNCRQNVVSKAQTTYIARDPHVVQTRTDVPDPPNRDQPYYRGAHESTSPSNKPEGLDNNNNKQCSVDSRFTPAGLNAVTTGRSRHASGDSSSGGSNSISDSDTDESFPLTESQESETKTLTKKQRKKKRRKEKKQQEKEKEKGAKESQVEADRESRAGHGYSRGEVSAETTRLIQKKHEQLREERERLSLSCRVCMDVDIGVMLMPCSHSAVCVSCSKELYKCPICRKEIENSMMIFLVGS